MMAEIRGLRHLLNTLCTKTDLGPGPFVKNSRRPSETSIGQPCPKLHTVAWQIIVRD